ncbi:4'-phosphopantetheinyl transferase family protein [Streptococcus ratti]|uniref:4'-phosphopantetheinyl transferase superfamily protein n=1 Tax=Streptococcus ratti TaxID=1341 RepID=A0A7X9LEN4_STRRT|nr:4'-phosphopantetheinyl transferase superfamily protein [Streptococcus ratti]NMD49801.1 4'-phosphopantetheinyl transferase superfamily protein [Streptococcus ratti]
MNNIKILSIKDISVEAYQLYLSLASPFKKRRLARYRDKNDKLRSIASDILIRQAVSAYKKIPIETVKILTNPFGKPYTPNCRLEYNVSHSHQLSILGCCLRPIGVDIEKMEEIEFDAILKQFGTELEYSNFKKSNHQKEYFYKIWTLKEAYFKCLGTGITDLQAIEIIIKDNRIITNKLEYRFESFLVHKDYMAAVCYQI